MDEAESQIIKIYEEIKGNLNNIRSEEDAKVKIINRVLTEVLGWGISDFYCENNHGNGFSDYILKDHEKPVLLIEAKRLGIIEVETAKKDKVRHLKIKGSSLKTAVSGIDQASSYATPNGLPIAVLTDGEVWIIFKTFIPGENFKNKEAVVFPSFSAIINDFSKFFDLLSKEQFLKKVYNSFFDKIHNKRLLLTQSLMAPIEERDIKLAKKSEIAYDLDKVFVSFFSRLAGDQDEDLLIECFVESHESRLADFSLEKITTSVLGNILPRDRDVTSELASLIKTNIETEHSTSESGQTVFIVGPTGAGKTTFLDRFFKKTLPSFLRHKCILLKINCLDASGREDTVLDWITECLIKEVEKKNYKDGSPNWDELLGLYMGEYTRRANGVDSQLYKTNKARFKEKFGEYLDEKVETDREGYLKRILLDIVHNRKMLPIMLVDNSDEFSSVFKEKLFQFTQSLRRHAKHCLVIFPVTDKSAWAFSKTDIFGIYKSRSFFLPTPSPTEVFRKRIDFLKYKLSDDETEKSEKKKYFSDRGIKISIEDLGGFAKVLENIFVNQDYTSKTIGELTNFNIRRTLLLSQRVITSSIIKIDDLIKSYVVGDPITTDFTKFIDSLLKGDYEIFKQGDNHEIYPIFKVDNSIRHSPLLRLRILTLLQTQREGTKTIEDKHLSVTSINNYFDAIGYTEQSIDKSLSSLLRAGLVEPYDSSSNILSSSQKLAISYRGIAHLRLASNNTIFFYQMAVTTAITNSDLALEMRSIYKAKMPFLSKLDDIKHKFYKYLLEEDRIFANFDNELDQYDCQRNLNKNLEKFGDNMSSLDDDFVATMGEEYLPGMVKKQVIGTVDYYDKSKRYGFVDVEGLDSRVFIHSDKITSFDLESLKNGDTIICDIERGVKGFSVSVVYEIEVDELEEVECKIIRFFKDRGYGFMAIKGSDRDAYFHISLFPDEIRHTIGENQSFRGLIGQNTRSGEGFQVKEIVSYITKVDEEG